MWKFRGSTSNDSFILDGIDIFKQEWINTKQTIEVKDPLYNQSFNFSIWNVIVVGQTITFAAGEFSNNIFGIYTE
ncbi:hypothetical protein D7Z26_10285 [Cohnella endophytica]|uniref:Uncharacterized protein n=1 Tax=Cohnella endophytica TaxID=2419778 RepID=A0A494Y4S6_9BACL|nr:hypothetical protein [Cohnella endophytica]RKP55561.1 hypothetical protein D7Z26_10285 [Cohnella endophytica]